MTNIFKLNKRTVEIWSNQLDRVYNIKGMKKWMREEFKSKKFDMNLFTVSQNEFWASPSLDQQKRVVMSILFYGHLKKEKF